MLKDNAPPAPRPTPQPTVTHASPIPTYQELAVEITKAHVMLDRMGVERYRVVDGGRRLLALEERLAYTRSRR